MASSTKTITRRRFMSTAAIAGAGTLAAPYVLRGSRAHAAGELGDKVSIATWPNYHDPKNFERFTEKTGVAVEVNAFGSNEEMMAKMQAGGSGWDVLVPTNYTISDYVSQKLIEPLDLKLLPNFDPSQHEERFTHEGTVDGKVHAVPKDWGTTGYYVNAKQVPEEMTTWKQFWEAVDGKYTGRGTVHDYQLTTIGNALKNYGYSFNSIVPEELKKAEELLIQSKPHLFAITSDYQGIVRSGDAWLGVCWTGDALQLQRDMPDLKYVIGQEGGEIWTDFYAIPKDAPHRAAAYALIDFLQTPEVNKDEVLVHGYPPTDKRVMALLPQELRDNKTMFPPAELLKNLEFGAAGLATNEARAEIMARFKSA